MSTATYSPEDNKLRLYCGRVPREEFLKLRADGWICTPKQRDNGGCDFVATWSYSRKLTALEYGDGIIEDEDQPMAERAADRAERFSGYRDKRTEEATGHADRYDSQPAAHGFQSEAKAERAAVRHDRIADRACDAWSKAEYWTSRTAGVIRHALYKSSPGVRMGRIKTIEAELRKHLKGLSEYAALYADMQKIAAIQDPEQQTAIALQYCGQHNIYAEYMHPRAHELPHGHRRRTEKLDLYGLLHGEYSDGKKITGAEACELFFSDHSAPKSEDEFTRHCNLRLAYENQMLEAQGGRAAFVEMQPGGWLGKHQIRKVNRSSATGRVVSVTLKIKGDRWGNTTEGFHLQAFNIERLPSDAYRPPTAEDIESLKETKKAEKKAAPKKDPCPLINPTLEDAERLQKIWNDRARKRHEKRNTYTSEEARKIHSDQFKPSEVCQIKQKTYSANSGGAYSKAETTPIELGGYPVTGYRKCNKEGKPICKIRTTSHSGTEFWHSPERVIVITDKPQKPLPADVWRDIHAEYLPEVEKRFAELDALIRSQSYDEHTADQDELLRKAIKLGLCYYSSKSQKGYTDDGGQEWAREQRANAKHDAEWNAAPAEVKAL